jgi:glycosyltransferase involved in cell wall biosynthesis
MNKLNQLPVSIIIPVFNNARSLERVLDELWNQTVKPKQIVIIDSSDLDDINATLANFNDDIKIVYKKVKKSYPGKARNIGAQLATEDCIAFLDSKTVPIKGWLENSYRLLKDYDVIFGAVSYRGLGVFEKLICASIYGENSLEHISGTLILKNNFYKIGIFNETTRAGEDIDWRNRVKNSNLSFVCPSKTSSVYSEISNNLVSHIKRSFIYQLHGALVDIQHSTKIVFLSLFLIFLATLIPNWNNLVGYSNELLFIPHILKFFLVIMALFILYGVV